MQQNSFRIKDVKAFWDGIADEYNRINQNIGWAHTERFTTMQLCLPRGEKLHILNIWSRTGNAVPFIRQICPDAAITNLEASPRMIMIAREKYPRETFAETDLHDLPLPTESQDVVVSLETLEHVPDPLHFLLECHRVLKVGGRLILSTPPAWAETPLRLYETFFENHGEGPHRFRTVSEILKTMRQCGFVVTEHRGTVLLPVGPAWLKQSCEVLQKKLLRFIGFNRLGIRHFFVAEKREPRDPVWAKIQEEVLRPGLSMHSGTEVGLSKGTLELTDIDGACLPRPTGTGPIPEICYLAMPERDPDYGAMNESVFGKREAQSLLLGEYRRLAIANMTDEMIRSNGASGGLITGLLIHLLETGRIKGAVVLVMDEKFPWRAKPIIARTREQILASAQSKYVISPVNTILGELEHEEGPLAYVGLPHQVFAIRRLQALHHPSVRSIAYVFGPFFGNELYGSSVQSFLCKHGAHKEDIQSLAYRAGEWPGYMQAILKDGRTVRMPKFHANYLIPFHISRNSLLSHDLTNEFTDISGGDAWAPVYEQRGKGFSMMIVRTAAGEALVRELEQAGKIQLQDLTEEETIRMQSHGLDLKKRGTFLRLEHLRRFDYRIPDYGIVLENVKLSRRIFEWALDAVFWLCATAPARWVVDHLPESTIGPLFVWFRNRWKSMTKGVKKTGLGDTRLRLR